MPTKKLLYYLPKKVKVPEPKIRNIHVHSFGSIVTAGIGDLSRAHIPSADYHKALQSVPATLDETYSQLLGPLDVVGIINSAASLRLLATIKKGDRVLSAGMLRSRSLCAFTKGTYLRLPPVNEIAWIVTQPEMRRLGLGTAVVQELINTMTVVYGPVEGRRDVVALIDPDVAGFWESLGFVRFAPLDNNRTLDVWGSTMIVTRMRETEAAPDFDAELPPQEEDQS